MGSPLRSLLPLLLLISVILHRHSAAVSFPKQVLPTKSGYLTVNSTTGSSIFFTFYESQNSYAENTPILIWLQGGPGCSSMLANFYELGPWLVNPDLSLKPNPDSWNANFGLLFLDNPIGTGFSIAASPEEIPRNQNDVAKHLYIAIRKFIALDSKFKFRPVYITGESYAGKYLPSLGYYIVKKNSALQGDRRAVNLMGVAIGNGLTDPEIQVTVHGSIAYNLGFINDKQKSLLEKLQSEVVGFVRKGKWTEATDARNRVLEALTNMTGLDTLYDFRRLSPYQEDLVGKLLNNADAKKALGVNESLVFEVCSDSVSKAMREDVMKSVRYKVEYLVKKTKVLLYQGQCDLRDGVVSTVAWMKKMKWDGLDEFLDAERKVWRVEGKLAGYVQSWGSLSHVVVANAGHLVPTDQPVNSRVMIEDWVLDRGVFADGKIEEITDMV